MKNTVKTGRTDTLFVMIVFCVFAVSVLTVLILSAGIYRNMTDISRDREDERTILSYIWTKAKSGDDAGMIHVGKFDGISALFYDEIIGDTLYRTAIYLYDGWVMELFSNPESGLTPQDGMRLMRLDDLWFGLNGNDTIAVHAGDQVLFLHTRSYQNLHREVSQ